jgi:eukaryotic-like serine/threonine-protein kinase
MSVPPGTRLGPYEVVAPLGEGGMGEVYRATDTRLDRTVALKVLGAETVRDPAARERFEREARLIARLQHPHICVLHDVGVEGDTPYLVMELLAGETLDARLAKGRLPLDDALALGAQIAQALDAAHRQGIAHRDLKPANVMLVKGARGTDAKLLDFGVARPVDVAPRTDRPDDQATRATAAVTAVLTDRHTLVGTLPYMAPEQLAGQPADARTDLWALGCVLYEMLTGTRPFAGKTTASLMAAILDQPAPPLADRAPLTPPLVDHLVQRCLEKDPEHRWQSARDVALELDWARTGATATTGAEAPWQLTRRGLLVAAGGAVAGAAGGWTAGRAWTSPAAAKIAEPAAFRISPSPGSQFSTGLALSPDGRAVVVLVSSPGGRRLVLRRLDDLAFQELAGSDDAEYPFFSPDGRWIGFFASNRLWRIPVTGGSREAVVESNYRYGATWMPDGTLVFATASSSDLMALPPGGREPTVLVPASVFDNKSLRWPKLAANGRTLVFSVFGGSAEDSTLAAYRLDNKSGVILGDGTHPVPAVDDTLLYSRAGFIESATFDADALTLSAVTRSTYTARTFSGGMALLASAADGTVAWLESVSAGRQVLARYTLDGTRTVVAADPRPRGPGSVSVSPDGRFAAMGAAWGAGMVLVTDLERGATAVVATGRFTSPSFSADSTRLYLNDRRGRIVVKTLFSDTPPTPVADTAPGLSNVVALRDGRLLLFEIAKGGATVGRIVTPGAAGVAPSFQVENVSNVPLAALSPDGRWFAYRTGIGTIGGIVSRRVDGLASWRPVADVSDGVAYVTGWSTKGIYYHVGRTMYVVPVTERDGTPEFGPAERVFEMSSLAIDGPSTAGVSMVPDGQSFIVVESADDTPDQLVVMLNGLQALRRA